MADDNILEVGLCGPGRHEIKNTNGDEISQFLFPAIVENPLDFENHNRVATQFIEGVCDREATEVHLYCTGLTPCLTSFLNSWVNTFGLGEFFVGQQTSQTTRYAPVLYLRHHNRDTNQFERQLFSHQGLA